MNSNTAVSELRVTVEDWSRSRLVEVRGDKVAMEIARLSCSHCSTCAERMDTVSRHVHRAGLEVEWEQRRGGKMIVIALPEGADPIGHLRRVLDLRITPC